MNDFSVIISAPSGAGKSTLISRIMQSDKRFMFSVSTTTRPIRGGEAEGVNYYYKTREEFSRMVSGGEFLEWADVHGNCYGTTKKEVDRILDGGKIPLFDIDVQGAINLKGSLNAVFIFIVPPSLSALRERLSGRDTDSDEQINLRLQNASGEILKAHHYDYIIVNDQLDKAEKDILSVIRAEELKYARMKGIIEKLTEEK